ncbi:hypothetical protein ASG50_07650 [Rhizobium sp. Leaf386]|nr:hypothetical protein ASG50_07650 [Rhizobium sp. Leaf386]
MLTSVLATLLASAEPSASCVAAAHRMTAFLIEEAKGTRHERQIEVAITKAGGYDRRVREIAATMTEDRCAILLAMPDSSVRALAIATLPERNGK